jgi:pyrimidine-nucleoside phosphorylase
MSKKLAAGADAIVLDVKTGSGAFMKNLDDARALAKAMVTIGKGAGRDMFAFITDMDEPLGRAVGNALEVKEAIDTLKGKGPADFTELVLNLACRMVMLSGIETDEDKAMALLKENIANGKALDKLAEFVSAQGGDSRAVYETELLPKANNIYELKADKDGYITHINCEEVGIASLVLGGGRETLDSVIDLSVGIVLNKKCGDKVSAGDVLAYVHYNDDKKKEDSVKRLKDAYQIGDSYNKTKKVIIDKIC